MIQFWNPGQCSAKQYAELEGVGENGRIIMQNQQKAILDLGLLFTDDDDEDDDDDDDEEEDT